ncbi:MAG: FMN-dependent NADH-azoreductase [Panacagrimonas sp.]|jgi:FMN-dependent NADH-azoreductase|nr:NAD(P)H-dependent oxidoreductase [Panacagrimonas sp.]MCC2656010.1 FMN-dependent NADH-azoreductase [Panacagrimonas sp.]
MTPQLLQINTSLFSNQGQSSQLADRFVASFRERHPDAAVVLRDVAGDPVPHLDARRFGAFTTPAADRTPEQKEVVAYSDTLINELRAADVIVLGLPMYNFGVPSQLKSYFDHVARAGETFRYTANGPEGLIKNKKAYVFAARGGHYLGTPLDTQTSYVRDFLRFIGIEDVEFIYAEGLAIDAQTRTRALEQANESIDKLAA